MTPDPRRNLRARLQTAGELRAASEHERWVKSQALARLVVQAVDAGMAKTEVAAAAGVSRQTVHAMLRERADRA